MKKQVVIALWVVCILLLVGIAPTRIAMDKAATPDYKEVKATVMSAETTQVVNKKTGSRTNFYDVKVSYEGKVYDLINVHDAYSYVEGREVTALLSGDKLYANVEGIQTNTPMAKAYFVCLIGGFVMLMVALMAQSKYSQQKKAAKAAAAAEEIAQ
ncbi:MAG: penicillin-binding protein [Eubacterium sp.]|nr:penicillin-binding protein [Eubacterium sp.]